MGYYNGVNKTKEELLTYYQTVTTIHHLNHLLRNPQLTKEEERKVIQKREELNLTLSK